MSKLTTAFKALSFLQRVTVILSLLLLALSCTQPAFYIDKPEDPAAWADSLFLLFLGWMSFLGGNLIATFFWLANPLYLLSIILTLKGKRIAIILSVVSSVIALSFSRMERIMTSESGSYSKITSFELGYKLWVASLMIMSIGAVINAFSKKSYSDNVL